MRAAHFFSALALSSVFLASWANACGMRDNGATMTDPDTGIEIQKCAVGQLWDGNTCKGDATAFTFDEAVARYGQGEWRLITAKEAIVVLKTQNCRKEMWSTWSSDIAPEVRPPSAVYVSFYDGLTNRFWQIKKENGATKDRVTLIRVGMPTGNSVASNNKPQTNAHTGSLDTPERLQAAQANQQQADRAFAGKKRVHDDNANTEQPTTGSREGTATNRGPVRVNVAYCLDSYKRPYSGSLKCSAQRFGYTSLEPGQTVDVLGPKSGLKALTFGCKHPTKPYDVEFVNDGLSGRCAPY